MVIKIEYSNYLSHTEGFQNMPSWHKSFEKVFELLKSPVCLKAEPPKKNSIVTNLREQPGNCGPDRSPHGA